MMEGHRKFEFFEARFDFLLHFLVVDGNNFEHFLEMEEEVLEIIVFFNYFVDGECDTNQPLALHIDGQLIFLGHKIGDLHDIVELFVVLDPHFILSISHKYTFNKLCRYSRQYCRAKCLIFIVADKRSPISFHV